MSTIVTAGLAAPAPARAQTPPPAPASADTPADAPVAPTPEATPVPPGPAGTPAAHTGPSLADLEARLDEIDQLARIAVRKHELAEEEAAKRAAETPVVTADDKGFSLRSADSAYLLRLRGVLQVDGRFFLSDDLLQDRDTFLLRKFRPTFEGTLFSLVDFRFVPDFAGSAVVVFDAYLDVHPFNWLHLRAGKMKAPIGLERLQSDVDVPFIERALDSNLSTNRDLGVLLWGDAAGGVVYYGIGVFNGGVDGSNADLDSNHAKDFAARLFFQPFKAEGLASANLGTLGFGVAASAGNRKGLPQNGTTAAVPGLPVFRTAGQNTFFSYRAVSNPASDPAGTGTVFIRQPKVALRLNPELYYYNGPFGLLAEYILSRQTVQRGNDTATLTNHAAHGSLTFVVNGKAAYEGAAPLVPFDLKTGAWGALELGIRYDWLKVDPDTFPYPAVAGAISYADPLASARVAQSWTVAANYIPRRSLRISLDFEQTFFSGGAAGGADRRTVSDRKKENLLVGRAQISF